MSLRETVDRIMTQSKGFDDATDEEKTRAVRELIEVASVAGAALSLQPIPLLDTALLLPIHVALVQAIGRVHGYELDRKSVLEILGTFGATLLSQHVVRSAVRLVPGIGWVMGASMGYAMTYAIGEVADHYFRTGRGVASSDLRQMFETTYANKRAEKTAAHAADQTLKQKLQQLDEAFAAGLITKEELQRLKEQILKSF